MNDRAASKTANNQKSQWTILLLSKRRWSSIELSRNNDFSSRNLIESIAKTYDIDLSTPRVRRRSIERRSALDLLNHQDFDVIIMEKASRSSSSSQAISSLSSSSHFHTKISMIEKEKKGEEEPETIKDDLQQTRKSQGRTSKNLQGSSNGSSIRGFKKTVTKGRRSLSLPNHLEETIEKNEQQQQQRDFTNEELYVIKNRENRDWSLTNDDSGILQMGFNALPSVVKNNPLWGRVLGDEMHTECIEVQRIKEAREKILEAARKGKRETYCFATIVHTTSFILS